MGVDRGRKKRQAKVKRDIGRLRARGKDTRKRHGKANWETEGKRTEKQRKRHRKRDR